MLSLFPLSLFHSSTLPLFHSSTLPLFHSSTLPLFHSSLSFHFPPSFFLSHTLQQMVGANHPWTNKDGHCTETTSLTNRRVVNMETCGRNSTKPNGANCKSTSKKTRKTRRTKKNSKPRPKRKLTRFLTIEKKKKRIVTGTLCSDLCSDL
jgi:hypothetical protein